MTSEGMDEARIWQQSAEKHNTAAAASPWTSDWLTKPNEIHKDVTGDR